LKQEFFNNSIVCPKCNGHLESVPYNLECKSCKLCWLVKDDIPDFSGEPLIPKNQNSIKEAKYLLNNARKVGWRTALYNYKKTLVRKGAPINEDIRVTDWRFHLPNGDSQKILIIGCGMGILPLSLLENNQKIFAIDSVWEKLAFLKLRSADYKNNKNLILLKANKIDRLPFEKSYFNSIIISFPNYFTGYSVNFSHILKKINMFLKPGGYIYVSIDNSFAINRLIRFSKHSMSGLSGNFFDLKNTLRANHFSKINVFAPLPDHIRIPLFSLPLDNHYAIRHFFMKIFPLFDMATPESKKAYGLYFILIKFLVKVSIVLRLTALIKIFAPGFSIIAKKISN